MQRMIPLDSPLPRGTCNHAPRHMHDLRGLTSGGGHFIECACRQTGKHADYADAVAEWCRGGGHPIPHVEAQRELPLRNVVNLRNSR